MTQYCDRAKKALIKITVPKVENIVSAKPPVNIAIATSEKKRIAYQDYTHIMTAPIDITFEQEIDTVELNDPVNRWIYGLRNSTGNNNPPRDLYTSCPTIGNSVVSGGEGLIVEGKRLHSNFDYDSGRDAYYNNSGSCTYRIYFKNQRYILSIADTTGKLFDREYDTEPKYQIVCDDECPPGYCKCECTNYPGYCCYDKNGNPL